MANIVVLSGTITEITNLQRDSNGKEWINFKLKIIQEGKETIIPCSTSGSLALKLDSDFYPKDNIEVTGIVSSIEKTSKVGNVYYELKVYANKVVNLNAFIVNDKLVEETKNHSVQTEKQAFPIELGDLDDELPF